MEGFNQQCIFIKYIQLKILILSPSGGGKGKLILIFIQRNVYIDVKMYTVCLQNQFQTRATYN